LLVIRSEFDQWDLREQPVDDRPDVLMLDSGGSLLVAELKRGQTADTTDLQALKYAAYWQGRSTKQIAAELHLATEIVRNHIRRIFRALGVHSRLEAVAIARHGRA
jgi:DNA-directed RNA polymerase specialized sigma24 family protein